MATDLLGNSGAGSHRDENTPDLNGRRPPDSSVNNWTLLRYFAELKIDGVGSGCIKGFSVGGVGAGRLQIEWSGGGPTASILAIFFVSLCC